MTDNSEPVFPKLLTLTWKMLVVTNCLFGLTDWPSFHTFLLFYILWWCAAAVAASSLLVMALMGLREWCSAAVVIAVAAVGIVANASLLSLTTP